MSWLTRASTAGKALFQLGPRKVGLYACYRLLLRSGILRWQTSALLGRKANVATLQTNLLDPLPDPQELSRLLGENGRQQLLNEAEEILNGRARLFGGELTPLVLQPSGPLRHWTEYEKQGPSSGEGDWRRVWEAGRFGWAMLLGRAYHLTKDERYARTFWNYTQTFLQANPPYLGLHWISGQEVALRIIALTFAMQVFATSHESTEDRLAALSLSIAAHALRIPPGLFYARAQNNNHLLSEAVGLYTAGLALPDHPRARGWRKLGWRWLNHALQTQIAENGTYVQHSCNYHRLMLQEALWAYRLASRAGDQLPPATQQRLQAATKWLHALLDPFSGGVPNLGANDGAYILPLTSRHSSDYRPVVQAAGVAFLNEAFFGAGEWNEMSLWLCPSSMDRSGSERYGEPARRHPDWPPHRLDNPANKSWAYLRVARFTDRPSHADQLHVDLWWRGINLAQDAGSYLYNAPPPWDNSLARSEVHNTLCLDGQDQMRRGGRFLWLDWAQAQVLNHEVNTEEGWERWIAEHDGYRRLGVIHRRGLTAWRDGRWLVEDWVLPRTNHVATGRLHHIRLHWLMPDWPWRIENKGRITELHLASPHGWVDLCIVYEEAAQHGAATLVRAGERVYGTAPVAPFWGWVSYTYAHKTPALSLVVEVEQVIPARLTSEWRLV